GDFGIARDRGGALDRGASRYRVARRAPGDERWLAAGQRQWRVLWHRNARLSALQHVFPDMGSGPFRSLPACRTLTWTSSLPGLAWQAWRRRPRWVNSVGRRSSSNLDNMPSAGSVANSFIPQVSQA